MTPQLEFQQAVSLHQQGKVAEAEKLYRGLMAAVPGNFPVRYMLALLCYQQTRGPEALVLIETALKLNPRSADALALHGVLLYGQGQFAQALAAFDAAIAEKPQDASAWYNRGLSLLALGRLEESLASQDRALALNPGHADAWFRRGMALQGLRRNPEARESYTRTLALKPDHAEAFFGRGVAAWIGGMDFEAAAADLKQALRLDPDCPWAPGWLFLVRQYAGDWRNFDEDVARIDAGVRAGKRVTEPFVYQAISNSPADLAACAQIYAADRYPSHAPRAQSRPRASGKIHVGYVSGEFRDQATAYLMAGLYECHDREKFRITAFDNGWNDGSAVRQRLDRSIEKFVDISRLTGAEAAKAVTAEEIDILVNLNGYFGEHRMDLFARRPAPLQVNYLGFPATLGADYMDYLIADRIVIPESERRFYKEQIAYLPDSYQVNDAGRGIAEIIPSRTECGLPETSFVFCNFNASYKLTPHAFAGWMRILRQVPGSVLWLLQFHPRFCENLRVAAEAQGISATRILFAPVVGQQAHLARLARADLFLDALPYNAHTTASDALWAGVPLVTCRGHAFAGRVAASLLTAIGLPELVRENQNDYEALAVSLAQNPQELASIRRKLAQNRLTMPLFDTPRFARNLEAAYETMWQNFQAGLAPQGFAVKTP